jgi:hypothetical protein
MNDLPSFFLRSSFVHPSLCLRSSFVLASLLNEEKAKEGQGHGESITKS